MHGRGHVWQGACVVGACMAGGHMWLHEQQELLRYLGCGITIQGVGHAQNRLIHVIGDSEHVCTYLGCKALLMI